MRVVQFHISFLYDGLIMLEIFFAGCKHMCDGCFNPELWDINFGEELSVEKVMNELECKIRFIDGVVLTGGDPLFQVEEIDNLIMEINNKFPKLKVWLYTGFTKEEIDNNKVLSDVFNKCDVVITDKYDKNEKPTKLTGSANQRIWRKRKEK